MSERVAKFTGITYDDKVYLYLKDHPDTTELYIDNIIHRETTFHMKRIEKMNLKVLKVETYMSYSDVCLVYLLLVWNTNSLQRINMGMYSPRLSIILSSDYYWKNLYEIKCKGSLPFWWTPWMWNSFPRLINYKVGPGAIKNSVLDYIINGNQKKFKAVITTYLSLKSLKVIKDIRLLICDFIWLQSDWAGLCKKMKKQKK